MWLGLEALEDRTVPAAGALDLSFGTLSGRQLTDVLGSAPYAQETDVALQSDGRIVAVGYAGDAALVVRYEGNGIPDTTFGQGGIVRLTAVGRQFAAAVVAIDAQGKILVAGSSGPAGSSGSSDFALWRLNADGTPDQSFGTGGTATAASSASYGYIYAIALQPDGKIVAAGVGGMARFNAIGTLDSSFGTSGFVNLYAQVPARDVAVQADGKIVIIGSSSGGPGHAEWVIARYDAAGNLDSSFGTGGAVTAIFGEGMGLAVQADGKLLAVGQTYVNIPSFDVHFQLRRFNANGSADTTFGSGGLAADVVPAVNAGSYGTDVIVQNNGNILVGGSMGASYYDIKSFFVASFNPLGQPNTTFGNNGWATTDFQGQSNASLAAIALQPDGKIVAAGTARADGNHGLFALARYVGAGPNDVANTAEGRYIAKSYVDLLGRTANPADLQYWYDVLIQSQSRASLERGLVYAPTLEWPRKVVHDLYADILGREPDQGGWTFWTNRIGQGMLARDVAISLYASPEQFNGPAPNQGGGTVSGYIDSLYHDILGRAVESTEARAFWTNAYQTQGIASVAAQFYLATESRNRRVTEQYDFLLNRAPDAGGLSYWADRLTAFDDLELTVHLTTSDEYFNNP